MADFPTFAEAPVCMARRQHLEEAAALIEEHQVLYTSAGPILEKRMDGNREGLAYAVAIRSLIDHELRPAVDPIRGQLLDALFRALPFVEDALDQHHYRKVYKPESVRKVLAQVRSALAAAALEVDRA